MGEGEGIPKNDEIEIVAVFRCAILVVSTFSATLRPPRRGSGDPLWVSMLPAGSYQPRLADDRAGAFPEHGEGFRQDVTVTPTMRFVTRWNLEKENPAAEKSPPKAADPEDDWAAWAAISRPRDWSFPNSNG